ncbi:uncharacterized protein KGF55_003876 [Candida pseudojiufengensis]|uniref:uncharacterized protein n=1 Tax=Candida pseudojiufengensis TaxID=497109 RepID=UPI002224FD5D|nr:uncharacterized protein KGF55_003876 [Candida pseudojiufengensis]KAI5961905.1 hypothetical protein KGF55_003876 [Candida pseudojiufengensis]
MLIKPITETRNPHHIIDDEEDLNTESPNPIPKISIELKEDKDYENILIVPHTLSLLQDQLPNQKEIGTISVKYENLKLLNTEKLEEYDEDEQLYVSIQNESILKKYPNIDIIIYVSNNSIAITIPHFQNTITYNLISTELIKAFATKVQNWILFSHSTLNNNQSINQLSSPSNIKDVPILRPPHSITGINAAIVTHLPTQSKYNLIVLNSEGQFGFEKSDNEAIINSSYILVDLLHIPESKEYLKNISIKVRKFNGFSNLGMYI